MKLTVFNNIFDTKTDKVVELEDFEAFEKLLLSLSKITAVKPKKGQPATPHDAKLMSPAIYKKGTTRANDNVVQWDFACLDVDDYEGTFEEVINGVADKGFHFVCYSTASSTETFPKFRLVFPLTRSVKAKEIRHFWQALNKEILNIADVQTKDMARMFFVPGQYKDAHNFIFKHPGDPIDPNALMEKHPYDNSQDGDDFFTRLPESMQAMVLEHRKAKTEKKGNVDWSSYRTCRYVSKRAIDDYKMAVVADTGKYHGMYRFMVSVAFNAIRDGYAIDKFELAGIARSLDMDHGKHYTHRPLEKEADRAIGFAYRNQG